MNALHFEWDPVKAVQNAQKHGVAFDDAQSVFTDDDAILLNDPDHSEEEDRFVLLGLSASLRILVVAHCYLEADSVIRIISARRATRSERVQYDAKRH